MGKPIAAINRGRTRVDHLFTLNHFGVMLDSAAADRAARCLTAYPRRKRQAHEAWRKQ